MKWSKKWTYSGHRTVEECIRLLPLKGKILLNIADKLRSDVNCRYKCLVSTQATEIWSLPMHQIKGAIYTAQDEGMVITWLPGNSIVQSNKVFTVSGSYLTLLALFRQRLKYVNQSDLISRESPLTIPAASSWVRNCDSKFAVSNVVLVLEHLNQSWIRAFTSSGTSSCGQ